MLGGKAQSFHVIVTPEGASILAPKRSAEIGSIAEAVTGSADAEIMVPIRLRLATSSSSRTVIRLSLARVAGSTRLSTTLACAVAVPPVTATDARPSLAFASIESAVSVSRPLSDGRFDGSVSDVAR